MHLSVSRAVRNVTQVCDGGCVPEGNWQPLFCSLCFVLPRRKTLHLLRCSYLNRGGQSELQGADEDQSLSGWLGLPGGELVMLNTNSILKMTYWRGFAFFFALHSFTQLALIEIFLLAFSIQINCCVAPVPIDFLSLCLELKYCISLSIPLSKA